MKFVHRLAQITVAATFVLLVAGGLVTSTGSGLAVPDWPLAFGKLFTPMVGGVFYEHGHRLIASGVAGLSLILCLAILFTESRAWVRKLAIGAFGVVCLQAVLGGATVLLQLPPAVSIAHAGLAEIFFALTLSIAVVTSGRWLSLGEAGYTSLSLDTKNAQALRVLSICAIVIVYVQILLGALTRHGIVNVIPHVIGALITLFVLGRLTYFVNATCADARDIRKPTMSATHLAGLQLILGFSTWLVKTRDAASHSISAAKIWLATGHLALGALVFACCVLLAWRVFKKTARRPVSRAGAMR